jgi:ankyrin repeat protein
VIPDFASAAMRGGVYRGPVYIDDKFGYPKARGAGVDSCRAASIEKRKAENGREILAAAKSGDLAKVTALLKDNPELVSSKDDYGDTPLHWAALNGHKDVAEFLLVTKADVDAKDDRGHTPLDWAVLGRHEEIAELLRQHGGHE